MLWDGYLYPFMVQPVQGKHIEKGIERYGGVVDKELHALIAAAGFPFEPYLFKDGRVLLVNRELNFGFLYSCKEEVMAKLVLE